MNMKAKEYENAGYQVTEQDREQNGVAGSSGYYVYYIKSVYDEPIFLAEWEEHYATAGTREGAINALRLAIACF